MDVKEIDLEPNPREVISKGENDEIYLSIKIGNGQIGGNNITSNDTQLCKGNLTEPAHLGKASDLKLNSISAVTNVLDVNSATNKCVITTTFTNGHNDILYTKIDKGDAPENGVASFKGEYVIKYLVSIIVLFFLIPSTLLAQDSTEDLKFDDIKTPASPGFILLDQTPSSIEKPSTPKGLGLSLLSLQNESVAIEFAPYWLKDHPNLTAKDIYTNTSPIASSFAFSTASVITDSTSYLTLGARTRIYQKYNSEMTKKLDSLTIEIEEALSSSNFNKVAEIRNEYLEAIEKPVFTIDFAAALGAGSQTNSTSDFELSRLAAWFALNWRPNADDFYFTVLSRYIKNQEFSTYEPDSDLMDLGIRFNYDFENFSASMEYLQRLNFSTNLYDDYKLAAIGSYKIDENMYLTTTLGKNFTDVNNIIALAGINFGFSKSKVKAY